MLFLKRKPISLSKLNQMKNYEPTLSQVMNKLKNEGYITEFNLRTDCLDCDSGKLKLAPEDFQIDKFYRFEGQSDPGDNAILYAVSSERHNIKGVLVNAYGIYSEPMTNQMLKKLTIAS